MYEQDSEVIVSGKFRVNSVEKVSSPYWARTSFEVRRTNPIPNVEDRNPGQVDDRFYEVVTYTPRLRDLAGSDQKTAKKYYDAVASGNYKSLQTADFKLTNDRPNSGIRSDVPAPLSAWFKESAKEFTLIDIEMIEPHSVAKVDEEDYGNMFHNLFNGSSSIDDSGRNFQKHQDHDQSSHGNWAGESGASKIVNNLQLWNESELSKFSSSQENQNYLNEKMLSQVENGFQADSFKKVVRTYQGAYGREINEALRDPLISEEQWQDDIDGLDNAIKAAPGVSEPTIVYRGIRGNGLDFFNSLKSGDVFQDKGFISTTLDTQIAFDFATAGNLYEGVVMKIKLPIGSKGLFPAGVTGLDFAGYESEFILPRDSKLKIVNNKGKVWDVEVVND
jgi:hypothetical protein